MSQLREKTALPDPQYFDISNITFKFLRHKIQNEITTHFLKKDRKIEIKI